MSSTTNEFRRGWRVLVASSLGVGGTTDSESATITRPTLKPGDYVIRMINYAAAEPYEGTVNFKKTPKSGGGKGKVALLMGPSGAPTFRNLGDGYGEVMAKYPGIQIVFRSDGPLTRERGVKQAEDVLVANPDLAAIYTANDDVALGAMQAVNAANRKGKTLVTGMNGVPPALRAVKEENLAMTVELNPVEWGRLGIDVLATYLKGDKVEPRVFIKHIIIDGANIDLKLPKT